MSKNYSSALIFSCVMTLAACSANPTKQWTIPPCIDTPHLARAESRYDACGPHGVAASNVTLRDAARNRNVTATIYSPAKGAGPFPLIVFSHGLGNSHEGYRYLGRHWASHGYIVVHLNHEGSDTKALVEEGMIQLLRALFDRKHWRDRARDVSFAISEMGNARPTTKVAALNRTHASAPTVVGAPVDMSRVGVAGHSYGAFTALEIIGLRLGTKAPDERVRAAAVISAPRLKRLVDDEDFARITTPVLHLTGTRDESRLFYTFLRHRRFPFDKIRASDQYLVILNDAEHSTFSDDMPERDSRHADRIRAIQAATTAFWDAYLKGDPSAKEWLRAGGFSEWLGSIGAVEVK